MPLSTAERRPDQAGPAAVTTPRPLALGRLYLAAGLIGLLAASVLLLEKIELLKNPEYVPTCSINPVVSCGSVMTSWQAEVFAIPNPLIGIVGFTALAMLGVAILGGYQIGPTLRISAQIATTFAVVLVHWLIYQSLYVIGALCPYCMVVWVVTIAVFWWTTTDNLQHLASTGRAPQQVAAVKEYRGAVLTAWYLTILVLIAHRFWTYWTTVIA